MNFEFKKKANELSALTLAFIGDSVHSVYVRCRLIEDGDKKVHSLHVDSSKYVNAKGQSKAIMGLESELTEEEREIYKRGRNAKSYTVPKNSDVVTYRRATGFEALVGWLYIEKREERLSYILSRSIEITNEEEK